MDLASEQLALANVTILIAENDLACDDLLIGLPILCHLLVDTRTLLERNHAALAANSSGVGTPAVDNRGGNVGRMMICQLHRVQQTN